MHVHDLFFACGGHVRCMSVQDQSYLPMHACPHQKRQAGRTHNESWRKDRIDAKWGTELIGISNCPFGTVHDRHTGHEVKFRDGWNNNWNWFEDIAERAKECILVSWLIS